MRYFALLGVKPIQRPSQRASTMNDAGMSNQALSNSANTPADPSSAGQQPRAPRLTLLIRAAKIVTSDGEFVCVIRDVSESGVKVRFFHEAPVDDLIELHMVSGAHCQIREVRRSGPEVAYTFVGAVDVEQFANTNSPFPKRGLRIALSFPARVSARDQTYEATVYDFSQQGARVYCDGRFAIDQTLSLRSDWPGINFGPTYANVRWRRDASYGLLFEETMELAEFARLAALLQCPALLGLTDGTGWG